MRAIDDREPDGSTGYLAEEKEERERARRGRVGGEIEPSIIGSQSSVEYPIEERRHRQGNERGATTLRSDKKKAYNFAAKNTLS